MTAASPFDLSVLEAAPRVPGKPRHKTREVQVGGVVIGGTNPVAVQSMTTTDTFDVEGTVRQIHALEEAGCSHEGILRHCRNPGTHVRGCWLVDLPLGKG